MAHLRQLSKRLVRQSALHFLVLGGSLFFLLRAMGSPPGPLGPPAPAAGTARPASPRPAAGPAAPGGDRTVVIPAARIARLRRTAAASGNPLSPADEARVIQGMVDEEILYREAVAAGLDRARPVKLRLIQNMQFLKLSEGGSPQSLYRQAVQIGFDRTDPVVRRFLVEQMRILARAGDKPDVFTRAELQDYLDRHVDKFRIPAFVRLSHVYLSADRRGDALRQDARMLLERLHQEHTPPADAMKLGDPFPAGHETGLATQSGLERLYGPEFAAKAVRLPVGVWTGPVRSAYGLHLVWVHETVPGEPAKLADVRRQVALGLARERQEERLAAYLRDVRRRYEIRIESPRKEKS